MDKALVSTLAGGMMFMFVLGVRSSRRYEG
jgi:hypothetical protein